MSVGGDLEVVIKRIDKDILDKKHAYPGISPGTKVLITMGGAVANATLSRLASAGCNVTVLGKIDASCSPFDSSEIRIAEGSIDSPEECAKAVEGQDVVFHTGRPGSAVTVDVGAKSQSEAARRLVDGTRNILDAAASAGVERFIFLSSAR